MIQKKITPIGTNVYLERKDLERMHTKQLIGIKHIISEHEREWGADVEWVYGTYDTWFMYKWDDPYWMYVNVQMLNNVLKSRPHFPSKNENTLMIKKLIAKNKRKTKHKLLYKK